MPIRKAALLFVTAVALSLLPAPVHAQAGQCSLVIHVDGFRSDKGVAGATLFRNPDGWPESNDKSFKHGPFPIADEKSTVTFGGLEAGKYAFAVIHDENENHKLDRNMIGFPKEGFGFANNPHVNLSAPSFEAAAVNVACPSTEITVHIQYK